MEKQKKFSFDIKIIALIVLLMLSLVVGLTIAINSKNTNDSNSSDKVSLVNKRELSYNNNDFTYVNLITQDLINNSSPYYYDNSNNQVTDSNYRTTPRIKVSSSTIYAVGAPTQNIQVTYYNTNVVRISTISVHNSTFTTPSNAAYVRIGVLKADINSTWFYQGSVYYNYFLPDPDRLVEEYYNQGYDVGFENGYNYIAKNIFSLESQPTLHVKQGYLYVPYEGDSTILGNGYFNPSLFFKGDYLDFDYLYEALRVDGMVTTGNEFMITWKNNYLIRTDNLNLKVIDPDSSLDISGITGGLWLSVSGSSGSQTIDFTELDINYTLENDGLLTSMFFDRRWPDNEVHLYNKFNELQTYYNQGYNQGYSNGESVGYTNGYDFGYNLGFENGNVAGYEVGYQNGVEIGNGSVVFNGFDLIGKGFSVLNPILNMQVLPGITIGLLIAIPIVIAVIFVVLKLTQR